MARLAAVQALYQMEHAGSGLEGVIREYRDHRLGGELDGAMLRDADAEFFEDMLRGTVELQHKIDNFINRLLREGWSLKRLDATVRSILRCGVYELIRRADVPYRSIIDQYTDIAVSFFEEGSDEAGLVNALLDKASSEVRTEDDL
ncbi:transcription antitermination factor NusB [Parvularcula sp. IMCC14364]|uniref:transcription antitermination factor NusB n=1 Tax=Parvularcula sp. IMCC14364 TaxID=3067902 RepID=UPI003558CDA9